MRLTLRTPAATRRRLPLAYAAASALLFYACAQPDGTRPPEGLEGLGGGRIIEVAEPWIDSCGAHCEDAYDDLVTRRGSALGKKKNWLSKQLDRMEAMPVPTSRGLDAETLTRRIREELRVEFLIEGVEQRTLAVSVLREERQDTHIERKLLFWDPEIGSFEGLLLLPDGEGPHPAVLALHGHRQDDEIFAAKYLGRELVELDFTVLALRFRAFDCSLTESRLAARLASADLTLMGVRVYEALIMLRYLRHLDSVDASRIGLLGHSGGTSVGHLLVRISDGFQVQVFDVSTTGIPLYYRNSCGLRNVHCETVPGLFPLSADINDKSSLTIPYLAVPYHFRAQETRAEILSFFGTELGTGKTNLFAQHGG